MWSKTEASFAQARQGFENSSPGRKRLRARSPRARPRFAPPSGTSADIMRPHSEFVRAQMRSRAEPAAKIGQLVALAAISCGQIEKISLVSILTEVSRSERASGPGLLCGIAP